MKWIEIYINECDIHDRALTPIDAIKNRINEVNAIAFTIVSSNQLLFLSFEDHMGDFHAEILALVTDEKAQEFYGDEPSSQRWPMQIK